MKVIPVIDIMGGVAVHARRGERSAYRPIRSVLLQGADPVALLRAYRETLECDVVYIADLDAIMSSGDNLAVIQQMAAAEPQLEMLVDAGTHDVLQARCLLDVGVQKVVVASESLTSLSAVSRLLDALGAERALFSLDLKAYGVIWREPSTESKDPGVIASRLLLLGFREVILLGMDRIGVGGGADAELLGRVATAVPGIRFIVGGGITSIKELTLLRRAGASGVLLATALHSGTITREDLIRVKADV